MTEIFSTVAGIKAEVLGNDSLADYFKAMSSRTVEPETTPVSTTKKYSKPTKAGKDSEFFGYGKVPEGEFSGSGDINENEFSGLGDVPNNEFAGQNIFPENAKDLVAVFLSISANHSAQDILSEFSVLNTEDDVLEAYDQAKAMISKDSSLVVQVVDVAGYLDIPLENLRL